MSVFFSLRLWKLSWYRNKKSRKFLKFLISRLFFTLLELQQEPRQHQQHRRQQPQLGPRSILPHHCLPQRPRILRWARFEAQCWSRLPHAGWERDQLHRSCWQGHIRCPDFRMRNPWWQPRTWARVLPGDDVDDGSCPSLRSCPEECCSRKRLRYFSTRTGS